MRQVSNNPLPNDKPLFYDAETQEFAFSYENGRLMVSGNNLSIAKIPVEDVIYNLLRRIEYLEDKQL